MYLSIIAQMSPRIVFSFPSTRSSGDGFNFWNCLICRMKIESPFRHRNSKQIWEHCSHCLIFVVSTNNVQLIQSYDSEWNLDDSLLHLWCTSRWTFSHSRLPRDSIKRFHQTRHWRYRCHIKSKKWTWYLTSIFLFATFNLTQRLKIFLCNLGVSNENKSGFFEP